MLVENFSPSISHIQANDSTQSRFKYFFRMGHKIFEIVPVNRIKSKTSAYGLI
jgi:hypothetical protein